MKPHVTVENGIISLEWWKGHRKLSLFIDGKELSYLGSWIDNDKRIQMKDGDLRDSNFCFLWDWLHGIDAEYYED